jgi:hypothetical protein
MFKADCLNKERELIKMLLAYLLRIFMGSMIFLLLLEELFDSQKFVLIKLSLIIIDFLILCYAFLSILHTP